MQDIEEIYKQYFKIVNKYLFCLTRDFNISEELTQETFFRAVKTIHSFKGNCKISVWLCQIAKHLWYDELKRNKRIVEYDSCFFDSNDILVEDIVIDNDEKLTLYQRLKKLDKETKNVIYMRITADLSFKEIAEILGKTENWARIRFYRGKQKLKEAD